MKRIDNLSNSGKQRIQLLLEDGSVVNLQLTYVDNEKGWYYTLQNPTSSFTLSGRRIVLSPNMLRAFRKEIPWGLACNTVDGQEPIFVDDFFTGRAQLFILNEADVLEVEALIKG